MGLAVWPNGLSCHRDVSISCEYQSKFQLPADANPRKEEAGAGTWASATHEETRMESQSPSSGLLESDRVRSDPVDRRSLSLTLSDFSHSAMLLFESFFFN